MLALLRDRPDDDSPVASDDPGRLPPRPRRRLLTPPSALVMALASCAIGVYGGIRIEKSSASSTSSTGAFTAAAGSASKATKSAGTGSSKTGSGAAPASFGGGSAGGASIGTVASVNGDWLVLKETSGDTVKVKLNSVTKITKSTKVGHSQVHPGDAVTVTGATGHNGTIAAASVRDSGATSTSTSSLTGSSSSSSSGSSVSSLFSSGG